VDEPAVDLGIVSAIASSFYDKPVEGSTMVLGEIGLTGEVRGISQAEPRVHEARKMGFSRCILPETNLLRIQCMDNMKMVGVQTISDLIDVLF
jgi:DNA repair protein RadA/Sms